MYDLVSDFGCSDAVLILMGNLKHEFATHVD